MVFAGVGTASGSSQNTSMLQSARSVQHVFQCLSRKHLCLLCFQCTHLVLLHILPAIVGYLSAMQLSSARACRQLDGKVKLGAVNCDEEKGLCAQFGIQVRTIPHSSKRRCIAQCIQQSRCT